VDPHARSGELRHPWSEKPAAGGTECESIRSSATTRHDNGERPGDLRSPHPPAGASAVVISMYKVWLMFAGFAGIL
jgi:hypothetical protein